MNMNLPTNKFDVITNSKYRSTELAHMPKQQHGCQSLSVPLKI